MSVFCPRVSGTVALHVLPERVAATPLTVTLLTPEPALALPLTVTGELVSVAPPAGEEIATDGGCAESSAERRIARTSARLVPVP